MPASVYALNLGDINLKSAPDQPFEAEIQLLGVAADEQNSLSVGLADVAGFRWAGIEWSPVLNQLQFELKRGADGTDYIRIHSSEVVRASLLHFLLKVAWSRGRLFREYTLELDTPLYLIGEQPVDTVAQSFPVPDVERDWNAVRATVSETRNYGPVVQFDTLWSLARELRPDTSVTIQQMMLALLRTNPDAFSYDNINWLKKDDILWMPNDFELKALSASEAYAEVLAQNNFWREARGYGSVGTGVQTASGTLGVDGGLRLVAVAREDQDDGALAVDPDGTAQTEALVLANEQVEELSLGKVELEDKLTEAETIIEDLRRLVELKDDELAALQGHKMSEQAEPGPGLLERLNSFYDSTIEILSGPKFKATYESSYNLARNYWDIALAFLAVLVIAGLLMRRRKADDNPEQEVSSTVAAQPDLAEALAIEKAVFPDEDNVEDTDAAAEESDFAEEIDVVEPAITDEIETGEEDFPDDIEAAEEDLPDDIEEVEEDLPDDMEEAKEDLSDDIEAAEEDPPDDMEAAEEDLQDDVKAGEDDPPDDMEAAEEDLQDDVKAGEDDPPDDIEAAEEDLQDDVEAGEDDPPDDMEAAEEDLQDDVKAGEDDPPDDMEAAEEDLQEDVEADLTDTVEIEEPDPADLGDAEVPGEFPNQEQDMGDEQKDGYQEEEDMVQNKLELARAYLELGDGENVRSILQEVLSEGNAAQREEARQLLEQAASE